MPKTVKCMKCGEKRQYDISRFTTKYVKFICVKCQSSNLCLVQNGNLVYADAQIRKDVTASANGPAPAKRNDRKGQAKKKIRFGLRIKMILLFLIVPGLIIAGAGYLSQLRMQQMEESFTQDSTKIVQSLAEKNMVDIGRNVALQSKLYLDSHPGLKKEDFSKDPVFKSIVLQRVGITGYTNLGAEPDNAGAWRVWVHPNPKLVGADIRAVIEPLLGKHFQTFFRIVVGVGAMEEGVKEELTRHVSQGYYKWPDKDGVIRDKFMVLSPVQGYPYAILCTAYMDEFTKPIDLLKQKINSIIETSRKIGFAILAGTLAIIGLLIMVFSNRYIIRPVAMLELRTTEISLGQNLDQVIVAVNEDEIGSLAMAVERLRISVALMLNRYSKKEER
ncbi:MAG: hypothetical protein KAR45_22435 [Desulfobacteraceae bacterium]|nr:hypothetical protein [Desulfobacteraceae bacterium]